MEENLCKSPPGLAEALLLVIANQYRKKDTLMGFPGGSEGKESACNAGRPGFDPWVGKIPWRRKWQSTPVCLPGEFHGQRSLVGYSPWGMIEQLSTTTHTQRDKVN